MSSTPRTDAEVFDLDLPQSGSVVDADFARQLERDLAAANTVIARKDEALREIESMQAETPPSAFPADWSEQIAACPRCRDLKSHPIMGGICDDHRQPFYHDEKRREGAERMVPSRMRTAARAALSLTPATVRDEVGELEKFIESCEREVAEVYCDITMGKFSKMNTQATAVLDCVRELEEERETDLRTRAETAEADVAEAVKELSRADVLDADYDAHTIHGYAILALNALTGTTWQQRDAARQPTPQPHEEGKR